MPDLGASPAYTLRPATAEDFPFLYDLHVATMKDYVAQTWGWDDAVQAARFREVFNVHMRRVATGEIAPETGQIVVIDGRDVGILEVERRVDHLFIANIEIAPAYQGRGLGAALIGDLLTSAAREHLSIRLQVLKSNPARHLYERLGFAITGETPTHYLMSTALRLPSQEGG